jgi:hypothetical protein
MSSITIAPELAVALPQDGGSFELRLADGRLLGVYIPAVEGELDRSNWPAPLTADELERITSQQPWSTTAEVLAHLKSL